MKSLIKLIAALLLSTSAAWALAQSAFPSKPIRLLVGYEPGGPVDTQARLVAQKISEAGGLQVIVENRPGADSIIASEVVAKSAPDGYTLIIVSAGHAMNPNFVKPMPYDAFNDFTPIAQVSTAPFVLVVHPSLPVQTTQELIQYAKERAGQLNYGSAGTGSSLMLAMELFKSMSGVKMTHIPYKGGAPATADLIAGRTQVMINSAVATLANARAGKLRALAVTTLQRSPAAPDLPPVSDTLPGFEVDAWYGILAPKGVPPAIVSRLNAELAKALAQADVRQRFAALGLQTAGGSPEQFGNLLKSELRKWAKVVADSGISVD